METQIKTVDIPELEKMIEYNKIWLKISEKKTFDQKIKLERVSEKIRKIKEKIEYFQDILADVELDYEDEFNILEDFIQVENNLGHDTRKLMAQRSKNTGE